MKREMEPVIASEAKQSRGSGAALEAPGLLRRSAPRNDGVAAPLDAAAIVAEARRWIGTPYVHRGALRGAGCDCLGLVLGVWRELLGPLPAVVPPYAPDWAEAGGGEPLFAAARRWLVERPPGEIAPGEVLLFRWRPEVAAKHLAIATDAGHMVHAHEGAAVAEVAVSQWRRRLAARFRFPGCANSEIASSE
jgi:NlpC/P60 family putative phage cell wall peptidase